MCGAPSMVSFSSMYWMISLICFGVVAEALEGRGDGLIDDLQHAAADELLVLDQRDVGLDAGGVAIHHEGDGAGGREDGDLGVAVAVLLAEGVGLVPHLGGGVGQIGRQRAGVDAVGGAAVLVDHAQEGLAVDGVAFERTDLRGDARGLRVRLAGEDRGDGGGVVAAVFAVVGDAAGHQQRAEVGVADAERAEGVRVLLDRLRRIRGVIDGDLLRGDDDAQRGAVGLDVEAGVLVVEAHQVQRGQVAGRVVEEHVLRARVRGVDAGRVRAGMPVVDGGVELHAGIAAEVGRLGHLAHQLAGLERAHDLLRLGDRPGLPVEVLLVRVHEVVGDAHGVVGVLELHGVVRAAGGVEGAVVAGIDQGPGLLLFFLLRLDEVDDVGMVGVEDDHLGGAAGLAAALDDAGEAVVALHEGDRTRGGAAAGQELSRGADAGEIRSRAAAVLEEHPLGLGQAEDGVHGVVDGVDEARRALRMRLDADVEPDRRVEGGHLVEKDVRELVAERIAIGFGGEVAAFASPAGDGADDAADELAHGGLAIG